MAAIPWTFNGHRLVDFDGHAMFYDYDTNAPSVDPALHSGYAYHAGDVFFQDNDWPARSQPVKWDGHNLYLASGGNYAGSFTSPQQAAPPQPTVALPEVSIALPNSASQGVPSPQPQRATLTTTPWYQRTITQGSNITWGTAAIAGGAGLGLLLLGRRR